jgi:type IV pilus assembly protein PilM
MSALQSLTGDAVDRPENRATAPVAGGRAGRRSWLPRKEMLGVDVGSTLIKAVLLSQRQGNIVLKQAVLGPTPPGVLTAGEMTDAITVANSLRKLCKEYRLGTRQVAVAVSGEKVYTQFEALPREFEGDLEGFVHDAIMKVIPYPFDGAAFDYERFPGDAAGAGVIWVSSASEQVEWVRETVTLAGKVPAVVDAQACALANAYTFNHKPSKDETVVLVHIGPRRMTVALVRGSVLLCSRDATLSRNQATNEAGELDALAVRELDRRWDLLLQRAAPGKPQKLYISGGAGQSEELREALHQRTGLAVEELNPFQGISYSPGSEPGRIAKEHGVTLAVAVGLALRGFDEI